MSPLSQIHWTCSRALRPGKKKKKKKKKWTEPHSALVLDLMGLQVQVGAI
jgi:hypothetical protein